MSPLDAVSAIAQHKLGVTITLRVQPRASRTELVSEPGGLLKLRVAAPPVDGAANQAVLSWLCKQLNVPRSSIQIISGERGRKKVILITGLSPDDARTALELT